MAKKKRTLRLGRKDIERALGAELPKREALSLLTDPTGALPIGSAFLGSGGTSTDGTLDPSTLTGGTGDLTGAAQQTALDGTQSAQQTTLANAAQGVNVPEGTATSTSQT